MSCCRARAYSSTYLKPVLAEVLHRVERGRQELRVRDLAHLVLVDGLEDLLDLREEEEEEDEDEDEEEEEEEEEKEEEEEEEEEEVFLMDGGCMQRLMTFKFARALETTFSST